MVNLVEPKGWNFHPPDLASDRAQTRVLTSSLQAKPMSRTTCTALSAVAALLSLACHRPLGRELRGELDGAQLRVVIDEVKLTQAGSRAPLTAVLGNIYIDSARPLAKANLSCVGLAEGDRKSTRRVYSKALVAAPTAESYPANSAGNISAKVVWIFEDTRAEEVDVTALAIELRPPYATAGCLQYRPVVQQ
jgi:hypothetical protein